MAGAADVEFLIGIAINCLLYIADFSFEVRGERRKERRVDHNTFSLHTSQDRDYRPINNFGQIDQSCHFAHLHALHVGLGTKNSYDFSCFFDELIIIEVFQITLVANIPGCHVGKRLLLGKRVNNKGTHERIVCDCGQRQAKFEQDFKAVFYIMP